MSNQIITTVDVVLFTLLEGKLCVGVLRRTAQPYAGRLALPGGYIHPEEDYDGLSAARRVLRTKTGIEAPYLEQLATFAEAARDPRGWSVSIAYYALVGVEQVSAQAVEDFTWLPVDELPLLPFDHSRIVQAGVERLRNKSSYSTLPCYLLGESFTLTELQETYETLLGQKLDKSVFRRKLDELQFLEATDGMRGGKHRPAQLYRVRPDRSLALLNRTF